MECKVVKIVKSTEPNSWYTQYIGKKLRVYGRGEATIIHNSKGIGRYVAVHNSKGINEDDAIITK